MKNLNIKLFKNIGFYLVSLYIFFTYIPQLFFHVIFHDYFIQHFNAAFYNPLYVLIIIFLFYIFLFFVDIVFPKVKIRLFMFKELKNIFSLLSFILIIIFLFSAIYFYIYYSISFRATHRLRETSLIIKFLPFLKEYAWFYVFFQLMKVLNHIKLNKFIKLKLILILIGWILSLNASLSIPLIFIIFLLIFYEDKLIFLMITKFPIVKFIIIIIISTFIVISSIFFGYADKFGYLKAYEMFTNIDLYNYLLSRTLGRLSTSFEALLALIVNHFNDLDLQIKVIQGFIDTFLSRLSLITHLFSYNLSNIETINRFNFFILFTPLHWHLSFAGASPGLLASIFYIPFFPMNFLLLAMYVVLTIRSIQRYLPNYLNNINIFGKLLLLYLVFRLWEAPWDIFYIIEPKFLFVYLFVLGSYFFESIYKTSVKGINNVKKIS